MAVKIRLKRMGAKKKPFYINLQCVPKCLYRQERLNQLNAEYAPDFKRFDYNLDLTEEESKKYLGENARIGDNRTGRAADNGHHGRAYRQARRQAPVHAHAGLCGVAEWVVLFQCAL